MFLLVLSTYSFPYIYLISIYFSRKDSGGQQPVSTDPVKRLRNLKKKLRDIEELEKKVSHVVWY